MKAATGADLRGLPFHGWPCGKRNIIKDHNDKGKQQAKRDCFDPLVKIQEVAVKFDNENTKKGGFEDIPTIERCRDPEHEPPMHLYIPPGKQYRHICPGCGKTVVLRGSQIEF
jgi:hypothetical protein